MRLNITLRAPGNPDGPAQTVGFTADALASIAEGGSVVSTVQRFDSQGNDLAIIEWPDATPEDEEYIEDQLEADDRVISFQ